MANTQVFQDSEEIRRLSAQNRLLKPYEQPVYRRAIAGRRGLKLLDIGCSDGSKTVDRFTGENFTRVIGLEYHAALAAQACRDYGVAPFAFYPCDVEAPDFAGQLSAMMKENEVAAFDIIHLSFVLTHLKEPAALLATLRSFLAPEGQLIVVEPDDSTSRISPDPSQMLGSFLEILALDPLAGDRHCVSRLPALLAEAGYQQITQENVLVQAAPTETQRKMEIFDVFFSYLPQDIRLLQKREPDSIRYAACGAWLNRHYDTIQNMLLTEDHEIAMGISIITCVGG